MTADGEIRDRRLPGRRDPGRPEPELGEPAGSDAAGDDEAGDGAAQRFAAALDAGRADPDLDGEIALARRLGALAPTLDPDPRARERARRRLLAALAREVEPDD